ncbi:hypothetical protein GCK32_012961 [Trichostrongylus colubriformis]|uniref:Uncharacterized protein n=1 Tax=Trichostrongylus colubriformis TaxID=6319 RepID=A0AAN8IFY8_TRICO
MSAVPIQDQRTTPRHIAEQLKRFVLVADAPQTAATNGASLSDAGFVLLSLKDQILVENSRSQHFCQEFIARPLNGVELLSKVVMVLQGIVNSNQPAPSKISNLLSRNNSNTNRKRKAAVAEADCIECLKILLERSLISAQTAPLGGMDVLLEELSLWRSSIATMPGYGVEHNHIYGLSETESDTAQSERARHGRPPLATKYPTGNTSVAKNVERQRFKKQTGMGSSGRSSAPGYYPEADRISSNTFYPDRRSLTLSNRTWQGQSDASYSPPPMTRPAYNTTERQTSSGMRRAKSESAMIGPQRGESPDSLPRGLKRFPPHEQQLYHPIQHSRAMSRSVHDLSTRDDVPTTTTLNRPNSARPSSARAQSRTLTRKVSTPPYSPSRHDSR